MHAAASLHLLVHDLLADAGGDVAVKLVAEEEVRALLESGVQRDEGAEQGLRLLEEGVGERREVEAERRARGAALGERRAGEEGDADLQK